VAFGDRVKDNILDSFPADDVVINVARFILAFSMFLTYPMQVRVVH
jgi:sodium-coupled neutral amino acid transporter 11